MQQPNAKISHASNSGAKEVDLTIDSINQKILVSQIGLFAFSGIEYGADYSANFVAQSLVDKQYVDTKVATSSAVPTAADKYLVPSAGTNGTSGNGLTTGLAITYTPASDSYVEVLVNGIGIHLGTSSSNGDGYFAAPGSGGSVGRLIANIQSGDEFFWNGSLAGYYLDSGDVVDFLYNITS